MRGQRQVSGAGEVGQPGTSLLLEAAPMPCSPSPGLGATIKGLAPFPGSCVPDARRSPSEVLQEYLHCREKWEEWFYVSSSVSADPHFYGLTFSKGCGTTGPHCSRKPGRGLCGHLPC